VSIDPPAVQVSIDPPAVQVSIDPPAVQVSIDQPAQKKILQNLLTGKNFRTNIRSVPEIFTHPGENITLKIEAKLAERAEFIAYVNSLLKGE
jgi:hypothetical protein